MITTAGADIKRFEDNFLQDSGFLGQKLYCEYLAAKDVDLNNFYCYENLNLMLSGSNLSCAGIVREHQKESLLAFCSFMGVYFLESRQDNLCTFPKQALSLMEYAGNAEESDGIICDENIYGFASFCARNFEDVSFDMVYSSFARKINKNLGHAYCLNKDGQTVSAAFACDYGDSVYITFVSTAPAHRKKGYAARVIRHIAAVSGGKKVVLMCEDRLKDYYTKLGFSHRHNIYLYKMRNDNL